MLPKFETGALSFTNRYLTWKINDFYSLPLVIGSEIRSPEFVYDYSRYTLVIWPRGQKGTGSEEWFGVCLYKYDAPTSNDSVQFSIATALGGTIGNCTVECSEYNLYRQERFLQWSDFSALSHKIVPDGCLTILCKLPEKKNVERCIPKDSNPVEGPDNIVYPEVCHTHTMYDPPVKFQSGGHHSPDLMSTIPLLKFGNPETQGSSVEISGGNCGSPSTINASYGASPRENSVEYINESTEAKNPDLKTSYNATNTATRNTLWSSFTRGFYRGSKKNKSEVSPYPVEDIPEVALDPVGKNSEESTLQTVRNSAASMIPETVNSAKRLNSSEVNLPNSTTSSSSSISLQSPKPCSNLSSQAGLPERENVAGIDSQRTAQSSNFSPFNFQGHVSNSTANSSPRSSQSGEPPSSDAYHSKGLKILSEQFKNLYLEGKDFDLSIIMGGKVFNVHSWMLKTRSPTFATLLSDYTQNVIKINPSDKCDSTIFHDILLYIYSGEIENLSLDNVFRLYSAACLFELPHLKEECIEFLQASLSIGTITNVLRSAGGNDSELLDVALVFLARNLEDIMFTDEWKQFTGEDPNRTIQYQFKALKIGYTKTIV